MLRRCAAACWAGAAAGCVAGALGAMSDYGAHWLWLDTWRDRGWLAASLLGLALPVGAAIGAALGALLFCSEQLFGAWLERRARPPLGLARADFGWAARSTALGAPGLLWVGRSLFTGGKMSRLPGKLGLELLACAALIAFAFGALLAARSVHSWSAPRSKARTRVALGLMALAYALDKLNQWLLPGLYDDLHAALAVLACLVYMGAAFGLMWPRVAAGPNPLITWSSAPAVLLLGLGFMASFAHLDRNQNVRVALLSPNVPHSRALMRALSPVLLEPAQRRAMAEARGRSRRARSETSLARLRDVGPVLEDAHVMLVTIDALRPDHLGTYGYPRATSPELDQLARDSVVFERVYAQAPHSSYSLSSIMASEYLHETLDLGQEAPRATLAIAMSDAGYHTAAFYSEGIFHTAAERLQKYEENAFGFALHDQVTYTAEQLTDRVLQEVDRTVARGEPNSFFWVHYFDVHEPYLSTHFGSSALDRYDSEILHVDRELARLVREVRRRLKRPVIVAVTADHGEEFREHGGVYHGSSLYEEQVRVPLLLNAPGLAPRRVASPVQSVDIAPTLLALIGLRAPASMRGQDLRPLAHGLDAKASPAFSAVIHKKMAVRWPFKLIADLRFGLFELYDLERDPHERENLADARPELLSALRDDVYAWLDGLAQRADDAGDAARSALSRGRVGDRRSVEPLARLLATSGADPEARAEAARILGRLDDERALPSLLAALGDTGVPRVAAEAAIALGRMRDGRARASLRRLVSSEDPQLRVRAAVSLGRLRDAHAVPALIEALYVGQDDYERQEAVRWLGRLRDRRALGPLLQTLPERRTRYLIPIALGMIGDARAFAPLMELLHLDPHPDVRDATLQGLGLLGDPRAIGPIAELAAADPSLKLATESLVRLSAIEREAVGGIDLTPATHGLVGFQNCYAGPLQHDWDYQHRTSCETAGASASLPLRIPEAIAHARFGTLVALSVRRVDDGRPAELRVRLGDRALAALHVDRQWNELRWTLPKGALQPGTIAAELESSDPAARFAVDHVLVLPRAPDQLAHLDD